MTAADVLVVGDGIVGSCVALELAQRLGGRSVALVTSGPAPAAGGASRAAGAMLGVFGEITKYTGVSDGSRAKLELCLSARERWPALLEELSAQGQAVHAVSDTFVIHNGRSGSLDDENWRALRQALQRHGEPHALVDEVPGLHPVPDARPLQALHLPHEGAVDAAAVLAAVGSALDRLGVARLVGPVLAVESVGDRVSGVRLKSSVVPAGSVVVAAGCDTGRLVAGALPPGAIQPIFAGSGVAVTTERVMGRGFDSVVRTVNRAGSCGLHVVPLGGGREYLGATNVLFAAPETRPHLGVVHFLAGCAMQQLDQAVCYSRIDQLHIGNRPVALDTLPLLGPTSLAGLHVLTGTYRDGFLLAPLLAARLADTLESGRSAFPDAFAPERPPTLVGSTADSVTEFCHQMVASAFEGGTTLTPFLDSSDLELVYRGRAEALYDQLGIGAGLPVDVVNFLTLSRKNPADVDQVRDYLRQQGLAA